MFMQCERLLWKPGRDSRGGGPAQGLGSQAALKPTRAAYSLSLVAGVAPQAQGYTTGKVFQSPRTHIKTPSPLNHTGRNTISILRPWHRSESSTHHERVRPGPLSLGDRFLHPSPVRRLSSELRRQLAAAIRRPAFVCLWPLSASSFLLGNQVSAQIVIEPRRQRASPRAAQSRQRQARRRVAWRGGRGVCWRKPTR